MQELEERKYYYLILPAREAAFVIGCSDRRVSPLALAVFNLLSVARLELEIVRAEAWSSTSSHHC